MGYVNELSEVALEGLIYLERTTLQPAGMKNGWRLQGKLADGTVVEFEAGASLFTDPISDVRQMHMNVVKSSN
ncbi:hypothetical protein TNCV_877931 [Trichonephila clavipes]|nr:hypothetical protein TNCV_877931 [Trichonephila clavipes]